MKTKTPRRAPGPYQTTAAYISGAIYGTMWMPAAKAGKSLRKDIKGPWGFRDRIADKKDPASFRDMLLSLLMEEGGDFQNAQFTQDTYLRVERRQNDPSGKSYKVHVWERDISDLRDCGDLVDKEAFVSDFLGDDQ